MVALRRAALLGASLALLLNATRAATAPAEIRQQLRSLGNTGTVLHLAAHPDDENTELITWLSRGRGYRTAYLSLTRGDGGQNELGRDFDEKLGVARTQELLAARRIDGGRQFFTRAIDFGFSKTPEETLRFWDRDQVLADVVRVIRQFQPDVIVTRFPVPPGSGGHGHHTSSAILAVEAFKLAADPRAYPEQLAQGLTVWQPRRVLWNGFRFGAAPSPLQGPTIKFDIAGTDPATGESFGLIAGHSRAQHKTQGLGDFVTRANRGANVQTFLLLAGDAPQADLMDGLDLTWARLPGGAGLDDAIAQAIAAFDVQQPAASVPALLEIRRRFDALPARPLVVDRRAQLDRIILACLGLEAQTASSVAEAVPGEKVSLAVSVQLAAAPVPVVYNGSRAPVLGAVTGGGARPLTAGAAVTGTLAGPLPADTPVTQPYWLRADGAAGISRVDDPSLIGRPENPPAVAVTHEFTIGGQSFAVADEPVPAGESNRRRLDVIPPVSLALDAEIFFVAPGASKTIHVDVVPARAGLKGSVHLELPAGWTAAPAAQPFATAAVGERARVTFTLAAAPGATPGAVRAVADLGGQHYSHQRQEIRYAHLPLQLLQPPARARLASFDLRIKGKTVGYLPGAGDYVAECLAQMGYTVRTLADADLTPEKLAGLDAVVIGVRAFNERPDFAAAFPGLLRWVEQGGTVIAQYNRPNGLLNPVLGPYPLSIQGPAPQLRVTDETAPIAFLAPDHPALMVPNVVRPEDFTGWVQERGAYFPSTWDEAHYTPLFALSDPGEAPLKSSVLVARHGRGHYVYTGLAFFRQLPAGVPSAWRLFANFVSLGK